MCNRDACPLQAPQAPQAPHSPQALQVFMGPTSPFRPLDLLLLWPPLALRPLRTMSSSSFLWLLGIATGGIPQPQKWWILPSLVGPTPLHI